MPTPEENREAIVELRGEVRAVKEKLTAVARDVELLSLRDKLDQLFNRVSDLEESKQH